MSVLEKIGSAVDNIAQHFSRRSVEELSPLARAEWRYELRDAKTGEVKFDSGYFKNVICDTNGLLLAALNKGEGGYSGIQYLAVGIGSASWDTGGTPSPAPTRTTLVSELARKAVTIAFLDAGNLETGSVTNRLKISATFTSGEANGEHREFGLFGGNATGTVDSGLAVNYRTQAIKTKTTDDELTISVRIIYS